MTKYYTLIGITRKDDTAEIIFGAHIRSEVESEKSEYAYNKKIMGKDSEYTEFGIVISEGYMTVDVEQAVIEYMRARRNKKLLSNQTNQ